eukprot:926408_1
MTTAVIRSRYLGETCGSSSECADGCACPTGICKNDQTKKRCPANPLKRPQTAAQIEEMIRTENVSPLKRPQTAEQIEGSIQTEPLSIKPLTVAKAYEQIYGDDYVQQRGVGGYIPMYDAPYH